MVLEFRLIRSAKAFGVVSFSAANANIALPKAVASWIAVIATLLCGNAAVRS